jgi:hypothetical protein
MAGHIHTDALSHFQDYPKHREFIEPFLDGFYLTRASKRRLFQTEIFEFFLSPEDGTKEQFGFSLEVLLVYSPYSAMQPRTFQAIENIFDTAPAKGRVETLNYILISDCADVKSWLNGYKPTQRDGDSRIIIAFNKDELIENRTQERYVKKKISEQFFERDLFDMTLPLQEDAYYFGRDEFLASYNDSLRKGANRGLFGLRKTGKTSLLYKLRRTVQFEESGIFLLYDCKKPSIRKQKWHELLGRICEDIIQSSGIIFPAKSRKYDEVRIADTFEKIISKVARRPTKNKVVIAFDEIEYISFKSRTDMHWQNEFVDFWQTIWSCQSENRNLLFIVAGVNPSVVDEGTINGIQNPLFGIVSTDYLTGFSFEELKTMITVLGKKMGLEFANESLEYLFLQYGGHPHLTRKACSWINTQIKINNFSKPFNITKHWLEETQESRDMDLSYYSSHVISEISSFYPEEYSMLEYMASGQIREFLEFSRLPNTINHLTSYGLLMNDSSNLPKISIPVVDKYIGLEMAKREGRKTVYKIVESEKREGWLENRKAVLIKDFEFLIKIIANQNPSIKLYGEFSFPSSVEFYSIQVCQNKDNFYSFINACYKCFVEPIDIYGKSINKRNYYINDIAQNYPSLFKSFERIRVYRHDHFHIELSGTKTKEALEYFLKVDLENKRPSQVTDLHFVLQQCVLDSLLAGLQAEINLLT